MPVTVVVGAQWGDEGKAKVIDLLSKEHTFVVRYQGGHNAGHTVVVDGEKYALEPEMTVYVPPGAMHYVWADPLEDLTYIVIYAPPGPEKNL